MGPENDKAIEQALTEADMVICGWGAGHMAVDRADTVLSMLGDCASKLYALRLTADGQPWHPLYLPYDLKPVRFNA